MIINNQTLEQRLEIFRAYIQSAKDQNIQAMMDDSHNFALIGSRIDAMGVIFSHENITAAIRQIGFQNLHWEPSPTQLAQQRAAEEEKQRHSTEIDRILNSFCEENPDFLKDDHNLALLVQFCKEHHNSTIGDVQIRHFWRVYQDSPEIHRLAKNAPPPQYGLLKDKDHYVEQKAHERAQREQRSQEAQTKVAFEKAVRDAMKFTAEAYGSQGRVSQAGTIDGRIARLEQIGKQFPGYHAEVEHLIQRQRNLLKF